MQIIRKSFMKWSEELDLDKLWLHLSGEEEKRRILQGLWGLAKLFTDLKR